MSYILEAIKKAESERDKSLLMNNIPAELEDESQERRIPWVAIAIFLNAGILLLWIFMQSLSQPDAGMIVNNETHVNPDTHKPSVVEEKQQMEPVPKLASVPKQQAASAPLQTSVLEMENEDIVVLDTAKVPSNSNQVITNAKERFDNKTLNSNSVIGKSDKGTTRASENNLSGDVGQSSMTSRELAFFHLKAIENTSASKKALVAQPKSNTSSEEIVEEVVQKPQPAVAVVGSLPFDSEPALLEESADLLSESTLEDNLTSVEEIEIPQEVVLIEHPEAPAFDELPYELQQQIPPIRISVHVYNKEQSARKVRVNGQLLYEGDQVSGDLTVEEITSYGVVFDYAGTIFRKNLR